MGGGASSIASIPRLLLRGDQGSTVCTPQGEGLEVRGVRDPQGARGRAPHMNALGTGGHGGRPVELTLRPLKVSISNVMACCAVKLEPTPASVGGHTTAIPALVQRAVSVF